MANADSFSAAFPFKIMNNQAKCRSDLQSHNLKLKSRRRGNRKLRLWPQNAAKLQPHWQCNQKCASGNTVCQKYCHQKCCRVFSLVFPAQWPSRSAPPCHACLWWAMYWVALKILAWCHEGHMLDKRLGWVKATCIISAIAVFGWPNCKWA